MDFKKTLMSCLLLGSMMTSYANEYCISEQGKSFIKKMESCSLKRYKDNTGYSIGYGHRIVKGENYYIISQSTANKLFNKDISKMVNPALNRILSEIKFKPNQNLVDAIGSLIYNCGESGLKSTEFYKRLKRCRVKNGKVNQLDLNFTIAAIKDARIPAKSSSCHEGVKNRRMKEYKLAKGI